MFGSMKKALVVAAVAGIAAAAPAVASADQWTDGVTTPYNGGADAVGNLTLTLVANGATTQCDVAADLTLSNTGPLGAEADGTVDNFLLGVPASGNPCATSLPGCSVTASASAPSLPWGITSNGDEVTISGVVFTNVYSGASCPLNNQSVTATGSVTGTVVGDELFFTDAGPLSTAFGPATVDGSVTVTTVPGGLPVGLV